MVQIYNAQLVEQLATDFPRRIEPNYAWGNAISGMLLMPRLRGLWAGSTDEQGLNYDLSGQGRVLTPSASPPMPQIYPPSFYIDFIRASSQYYYRLDEPGLDFGAWLTCYCWVNFSSGSTGNYTRLLCKWDIDTQLSWVLRKNSSNYFEFYVTGTGVGAAAVNINDSGRTKYTYQTGKWYFIAGVFVSSSSINLFVGDGQTGAWQAYQNTTSIPASIYNGVDLFGVGGNPYNDYLDGKMGLFSLIEYPMSEVSLWNIFQQTRPLYLGA